MKAWDFEPGKIYKRTLTNSKFRLSPKNGELQVDASTIREEPIWIHCDVPYDIIKNSDFEEIE